MHVCDTVCLAEGGNFKSGFLNTGKGKVADSEYLKVYEAGMLHGR
jgi:hypothetical protein